MTAVSTRKKVVIFGSGPKFKGGFANYNTSLAKAFDKLGDIDVYMVSWSQPYPAIIPRDFVDRTSKTDLLEGTRIKARYLTNFNNPLSWYQTYRYIKDLNPDIAIFQWAISIQSIPLAYIVGKLKRNTNIEVIFDLHFVLQKEESFMDKFLTKLALEKVDTYVAHAYNTANELKALFPTMTFDVNETGLRSRNGSRTVIKLFHPVYDMFSPDPNFDIAAHKKALNLKENVFLFFGFIRKYKGLHNVIRAFEKVCKERSDVSLLIVGESFWNGSGSNGAFGKLKKVSFDLVRSIFLRKADNEQDYRPLELISELDLSDSVTVINEFVPNEDVHKYFQVSNCIVLYYVTASPSGVESLAYNFKLAALATKVDHFPETIRHGYNGYLAEPEDIDSMAEQMSAIIETPIPPEHVFNTSKELSWENYAKRILAR